MTNSRQKGARGEREWAKELGKHGFEARRGQQFSGSPDSPDVVCEDLGHFHFEVKRVEALRLYPAMDQAVNDCGEATPVVVHKKNRKEWLVIMRADDWLQMVKEKQDGPE